MHTLPTVTSHPWAGGYFPNLTPLPTMPFSPYHQRFYISSWTMSVVPSSVPRDVAHFQQLSSKDTKVLRLTCHRLASVLAIHVLRSLTLEVNSSRHREELLRLQKLADGGSFEAEKVQELYVGTMAPRYCPSRPRCKDKFDWDYHPPPSETEMQEASVAEAELETRLFQAISSLKNVTFFQYVIPLCGGYTTPC